MAGGVVAVVFFFVSFWHHSDAQQSVISMNPSSGSLTLASNVTGGMVEVTCTAPPGVPTNDLLALNIERVLHRNQAQQELAGARGSAQAEDRSGNNVPGSSASGSVQQRSLKFTMPQTTCNDAGMYICTAQYFVGIVVTTATSSKNLSVTVDPGQLTMTANPQQAVYSYNSSLLLTCSGDIGTVDDDTQVEWVWEYKEPGGFLWTNVATTEDNFNVGSSTTSGPGNCAQNQVVTLQRYVVTEDTGRTYRCYVRHVGSGGNFDLYAGEYTIGTVLQPETLTTEPPESSPGTTEQPHTSSTMSEQPHTSPGTSEQPHTSPGTSEQPHTSPRTSEQPNTNQGTPRLPTTPGNKSDTSDAMRADVGIISTVMEILVAGLVLIIAPIL